MVDFVPAPHHIEAGETVDILMPDSAGISSTMRMASGFTITFGANCGSISTISAPVERILVRPSRIATSELIVASAGGAGDVHFTLRKQTFV